MNNDAIILELRGSGHVPSFKNNKMIARGRIITNPKRQKWMETCIRSIVSQLRSLCRTIVGETMTEQHQRSWTASSLPEDDCWQWIPELHIIATKCEKGQEGAIITIERLP